ncbi:50S ribosomal protein L11 methyltransferase [Hyphomicrobium sp. CS1BSMeth3]|uniref:50S ribosomal protein L11 methyltransferase n=1 Tax=Hyphomicrobium sp. CS1BSMeth3 TaxID=1892844 RepID=UPI0009315626|nr:50S ribosomal protein L11 methyltransferase [Hyphomicrobium sp. CS1BSMeth3]
MHRARIIMNDVGAARSIAGLIEEAVTHSPLAVSLFEAPGNGWIIDAYYEDAIEAATITGIIGTDARVSIEAVPDENWVAVSQAGLPPVAAGRFLVHGSHDRAIGRKHRNAIEIDAGEAFGTAHHATTLGCLLAIDRLTRQRHFGRVLDLGCGSGVLAIAVGRVLPAATITASDFDPEAVRVARENVYKNALGDRINLVAALGLEHPLLRRRVPFDLVVANILAEPLIRLAQRLAKAVPPRGIVVLSGILQSQAAAVLAAYTAAGFARVRADRLNGWVILTLERRGQYPQGR